MEATKPPEPGATETTEEGIPPVGEGSFPCPKCPRVFATDRGRRGHLSGHRKKELKKELERRAEEKKLHEEREQQVRSFMAEKEALEKQLKEQLERDKPPQGGAHGPSDQLGRQQGYSFNPSLVDPARPLSLREPLPPPPDGFKGASGDQEPSTEKEGAKGPTTKKGAPKEEKEATEEKEDTEVATKNMKSKNEAAEKDEKKELEEKRRFFQRTSVLGGRVEEINSRRRHSGHGGQRQFRYSGKQ